MHSIKIIARGTVTAEKPNADSPSCAFPQICVLPSGRWLCSYRAAPTKGATANQRSLIVYSDDEGESWSDPTDPFPPVAIGGVRGEFRAAMMTAIGSRRVLAALYWVDCSDPSLPYFNEATEGLLDSRIFLATSDDEGATWSEPRLVDTAPFTCPTPITGPVLSLPNGHLACQFELNKTYYDASPWRHGAVMMFSQDDGESWPDHVVVAGDAEGRTFYWDQRPGLLSDGRILDLFWTFDRRSAAYQNIHACESLDNGRTWSQPWDTGIPGQPAPPQSLGDGSIALAYVDRVGAPQIKVRTSHDGGRSWPVASEVVLEQPAVGSQTRDKHTMQDAWTEFAAYSIGLPMTARARNGDVVIVYYCGASTDRTDVKWARVGIR